MAFNLPGKFTTFYDAKAAKQAEYEKEQAEKERKKLEEQQLAKLGQAGVDPYAWTRKQPKSQAEINKDLQTPVVSSLGDIFRIADYRETPAEKATRETPEKEAARLDKSLGRGVSKAELPVDPLPSQDATALNKVQTLFRIISQCWNPAAPTSPDQPTWLQGREQQGTQALQQLQVLWRQAYMTKNPQDELINLYITREVLDNTPAWLNPEQVPLFEQFLANYKGVGDRVGMRAKINLMENQNSVNADASIK